MTDYAVSWKPILDLLEKYEITRGQPEFSVEERNILALEIDKSALTYFDKCRGLEKACGLRWEDEFVALFVPIIAIAALNNLRIKDSTKELVLVDKKKGK